MAKARKPGNNKTRRKPAPVRAPVRTPVRRVVARAKVGAKAKPPRAKPAIRSQQGKPVAPIRPSSAPNAARGKAVDGKKKGASTSRVARPPFAAQPPVGAAPPQPKVAVKGSKPETAPSPRGGKSPSGSDKISAKAAAAAKLAAVKAAVARVVAKSTPGKPAPRMLVQTGKPILRTGADGVRLVRRHAPSAHGSASSSLPHGRLGLSSGASSRPIPGKGKNTKPMNRKSSYKKAELQHYEQRLLEKRESLAGDLRSMESQAFRQSGTESAPNHMADYGSDTFEQDFTLGLIESDEKVIAQINEALVRIGKGVFGICEGCSIDIPKARLEVLPWAALCVNCQSQAEKR